MLIRASAVYFVYPETCGVRLEDMDSLFGDASTAMGTPGLRSESGSMFRAGSPVPSLDLRGRPAVSPDAAAAAAAATATGAIPPLLPLLGADIDPPAVNMVDGRPQYSRYRSDSRDSRGRVGEWLTRMVGQARGASSSPSRASSARYAPLDQQREE